MDIPVFHRVKYPNRIFIKDIVVYLHRVSLPVNNLTVVVLVRYLSQGLRPSHTIKPDQQPFVFSVLIAFKITVIDSVII